jgi:hypothetical protein
MRTARIVDLRVISIQVTFLAGDRRYRTHSGARILLLLLWRMEIQGEGFINTSSEFDGLTVELVAGSEVPVCAGEERLKLVSNAGIMLSKANGQLHIPNMSSPVTSSSKIMD